MIYWDRQYNPRALVADAETYFNEWRARAAAARNAHPGCAELLYGEHERERLDLFRSTTPRGTLIFLHGGYWRAFSKDDFSWIAASFVRAGITVAIANYPLCPRASLARVSLSVTRAIDYLVSGVLTPAEQQRIVLAGHSAGAYLAACNLAHPRVSAFVGISGIFDLLPLLHAPFLSDMGWNAASLHEASPLYWPAPSGRKMLLAMGSEESPEFHRQSERLAGAWEALSTRVLHLAGKNHFSILDSLCEPNSLLARETHALFNP